MARTRNKAFVAGYVGQEPELRHTDNGTAVINIRVATNFRRKVAEGEYEEQTEWHNIVAFSRLAEILDEYVDKGSFLDVEGYLKTNQWEDRDGNKRYTTEIVATEAIFFSNDRSGGQQASSRGARPSQGRGRSQGGYNDPFGPEDDLPF